MIRPLPSMPLVPLALMLACGGAPPEAPAASEPPPSEAAAPAAGEMARVSGRAPAARGMARSIVVLEPHGEIDVPVPEEMPVMDQYGRQFVPTFLMVRAGQTINFTNSEDDLHTVHMKDEAGESLINVATIMGSSYEFLVERPGVYTVICNTHTEMFADILAFDTPYFVQADEDGGFTLDDVLPGRYTAIVIFGSDRTAQDVEIVAGLNDLDLAGGAG